jgi:hypothetical protein
MMNVTSALLDRPRSVTFTLLALAAAHTVMGLTFWPASSVSRLISQTPATDVAGHVSSLALGVAGVAAMVGGFAGVVVVFGLSSNDERFREVRLKASSSLRRNWTSIVTLPLVSAFGALIAAALAIGLMATGALIVLEFCVLLVAHGAVRLTVVLNQLIKVVHASDELEQGSQDVESTDDFYQGVE